MHAIFHVKFWNSPFLVILFLWKSLVQALHLPSDIGDLSSMQEPAASCSGPGLPVLPAPDSVMLFGGLARMAKFSPQKLATAINQSFGFSPKKAGF